MAQVTQKNVHVRLFQARLDACPYAFRPLADAGAAGGPWPSDYEMVHEADHRFDAGAADEAVLEQLFRIYNADDRPGADRFRSMSVSDVVELSDGSGTRCWYCDTAGFKPVPITMP